MDRGHRATAGDSRAAAAARGRRVRSGFARAARLAALAWGCCAAVSARGDETLWCRALGVDQGLSQNFVTAITQDRDGFLWFGTLGGLSRWDGYAFQVFAPELRNPASLSDAAVLTLHADAQGRVWAGTSRGLDGYEPRTGGFVRHGDRFGGPGRAPAVEGITSDRAGRIWFASFADGRLFRIDPRTGRGTEHRIPGLPRHWITALLVDRSDRLWVATQYADADPAPEDRGFRLFVFERCGDLGDDPLPIPRQPVRLDEAGGKVVACLEDSAGRLWLGRNGGGLWRLDPRPAGPAGAGDAAIPSARLAADPANPGALAHGLVQSLAAGPAGEIWVLTKAPAGEPNRLHRVDADSLAVHRIALQEQALRPGDDARLERVAVDHSGTLWIGSNAGGLRYADVGSGGFGLYRKAAAGRPGLNAGFVRAICVGRGGTVWVGTPAGVSRIDRTGEGAGGAETVRDAGLALPDPNVQALWEDRRGDLWVATGGGLARIERASGAVRVYRHDGRHPDGLADSWVQVIHEDPDGRLWFGTLGGGLDEFDPQTGSFRNHPGRPGDAATLPGGGVHALRSGPDGRLWVGTATGLARLDPLPGGGRRAVRMAAEPEALGEVAVFSLGESAATPGILWVGTGDRGLGRLDLRDGTCRFYTRENSGLPDNTVYGIQTDRQGRLWISTNRGLVRFHPATGEFRTYGPERGIQSNEFNARAHAQGPDGEMFFGGVGGLNLFHPEAITDNALPPRVFVTGVRVLDRGAKGREPAERPVHRHGQAPAVVEIPPRERDVTFDFVALHFSDPAGNRYEHRLDPYDPGWHGPVGGRSVRYTNLDPGAYTFRVRALSSQGVRSAEEAAFAFVVRPPFHATAWFRALAGTGAVLLLAGGHRWRVRHLRRRQREIEAVVARRTEELRVTLATVEEQARRLQALDAAKSRFFATISHEFRTPLMLTLGPLRDVQAGRHGPIPEQAGGRIELAIRNAGRQLELVEQLLLLARLDAGQPGFHPRDLGLDDLLRRTAADLEPLAAARQIRLRLELPEAPLRGRFDERQIGLVFGNLLGNALKYVPAGGEVTLRLAASPDGWAVVEVADTGPGIPAEDLPRLFERFYRGASAGQVPGTGLGLAVARECVELHGGDIRAENRPEGGARFTVRLPLGPAAPPGP